jgi:Tol biopolymer transport system component
VIIAGNKGAGGLSFLMIPISGAGNGRLLMKGGEGFLAFSDDGGQILYTIPSGPTTDIGILNRKDGTTRQLTKTSSDEVGAVITPDGKTVLFQRSRTIRRIAIADLSKLRSGTGAK